MAFGTLQSGLLVFIFPIWMSWKQSKSFSVFLWKPIIFPAIGVLAGYPWLLFSGITDPTLGHGEDLNFSFLHGIQIIKNLVLSEGILLAFCLSRVRRIPKEVLIFSCIYLAIFTFYATSGTRYFVALLPLLAATTIQLPIKIRTILCLIVLSMTSRWIYLAHQQNTFEEAAEFLIDKEGYFGSIGSPAYFIPLPPSRVVPANKIEEMTFIVAATALNTKGNAEMHECFNSLSSKYTNQSVLLWVDTPFALRELFTANRLGPNLKVYCKK